MKEKEWSKTKKIQFCKDILLALQEGDGYYICNIAQVLGYATNNTWTQFREVFPELHKKFVEYRRKNHFTQDYIVCFGYTIKQSATEQRIECLTNIRKQLLKK